MINNKTYSFITLTQLLASVASDYPTYDEKGFIDENTMIKEVMKCNEKMGLVFSEMKQTIFCIHEYKADLPPDFYKVYYMCALNCSNFSAANLINPWDNTIDQTVTYEADLKKGVIGCDPNTLVIYKKDGTDIEHQNVYYNWDELSVSKYKKHLLHVGSPITNRQGKYVVDFTDTEIITPFRTGEVYMMYLAAMRNEEGEILVPFHPMVTPWYEAVIAEKMFYKIIMNSDEANTADKFKLAQQKTLDTWLDAWNFTFDRTYQQMLQDKADRETKWYNQYFRPIEARYTNTRHFI